MARRKSLQDARGNPSAGEGVALDTKIAPSQERARTTFETILAVTGELLGEVGVERLSTNIIADRCGITPPALYRYFPNKYAILHEMGRRLLAAEDEIVLEWLNAGGADGAATLEEEMRRNAEMLRRVRDAARAQPGGIWMLRVMRAVPILREARAESIQLVSSAIYDRLRAIWPDADEGRLRAATLLSTNLTAAANEMMIEEPALEDSVADEIARMMALYYRDLLKLP